MILVKQRKLVYYHDSSTGCVCDRICDAIPQFLEGKGFLALLGSCRFHFNASNSFQCTVFLVEKQHSLQSAFWSIFQNGARNRRGSLLATRLRSALDRKDISATYDGLEMSKKEDEQLTSSPKTEPWEWLRGVYVVASILFLGGIALFVGLKIGVGVSSLFPPL